VTQRRRFIILALVALAVIGTFMLKGGNEVTSVTEGYQPRKTLNGS